MFMNTRNTKANGAHNFFPNLSQRLVHKVEINMFLLKTYLFIIGGKLKIIAATWNDKFELPDGSYFVADISDYIDVII